MATDDASSPIPAGWRLVKQERRDDCHRAAIATLLGLSLHDVPHFFEDAVPGTTGILDVEPRIRDWAAQRGLGLLMFSAQPPLEALLANAEHINPGVPFILSGASYSADFGHSVVCCGGRIVHDPRPDMRLGEHSIAGPLDGSFYVTFFTTLPWANAGGLQR